MKDSREIMATLNTLPVVNINSYKKAVNKHKLYVFYIPLA